MPKIPIDFDQFLSNHPFHYEIYSKVNGAVAKFSPPCCIQVSYALNMTGAPVMKGDFYVPEMGRKSRFIPDSSDNLYLIEVCDMGAYLNGRYGIAENYQGSKDKMKKEIEGRKGIIRFGKAHIDVWEGDRFHQENTSSMPDNWAKGQPPVVVWDRPSVKTMGIFFWEVGNSENTHYHEESTW